MLKVTILILTTLSFNLSAQQCFYNIPPASSAPGGGVYHVQNDSTINDQDGSIYYLCSGVHLTVDGSAGCSYYMEDNSQLTIRSHNGDVVNAKGNCTIIDSTTQSIVVNKEASSTFSKPLMPSQGFVFTCSPMVYDYSQVGGSAPCGQATDIDALNIDQTQVYPNPSEGEFTLDLGREFHSINISIHDLNGRQLQKSNYKSIQTLEMDIDLPSGIYLLKAESGSHLVLQRLVIK